MHSHNNLPKDDSEDKFQVVEQNSNSITIDITGLSLNEIVNIFSKLDPSIIHLVIVSNKDWNGKIMFGNEYWRKEFQQQFPIYFDPYEKISNWFEKFRHFYLNADVISILLTNNHVSLTNVPSLSQVSKKFKTTLDNHNHFWKNKFILHFPHRYKADEKVENWKKKFHEIAEDEYAFSSLSDPVKKARLKTLFCYVKESNLASIEKIELKDLSYELLTMRDKDQEHLISWASKIFKSKKTFESKKILEILLKTAIYYAESRNALRLAVVFSDSIDIIECIAKQKTIAKSEKVDSDYIYGPLHAAAYRGRLDILKLLLNRGSNKDALTTSGATSLLFAVEQNFHDLVKELLSRGVNTSLSLKNKDHHHDKFNVVPGDMPMHAAAKLGHTAIMMDLLAAANAPNVNTVNAEHASPLLLAVERGHLKTVEVLISQGAHIITPLKQSTAYHEKYNALEGDTALHVACKSGQVELVKALLGYSIHTNIPNELEPKKIYLYLETDDTIHFKTNHSAGSQIEAELGEYANSIRNILKNPKHEQLNQEQLATIFKAVATHGYQPFLIANGPSPLNAPGFLKNTPLHCAAQLGNVEIINLLLHHQVDMNVRNEFSQTALELAFLNKNDKAVQLLLKSGADTVFSPASAINKNPTLTLLQLIHDIENLRLDTSETTRNIVIRQLKEKAKTARFAYDGDDQNTNQLIASLEDLKFIQRIDNYAIKFDLNDDKKNPQRSAAIIHYQSYVDQAYKQEISYLALIRETNLLHNLDLIVQTLSTLTYRGQNTKFKKYLLQIQQTINPVYSHYVNLSNNLIEREVYAKQLITLIHEVFSKINIEYDALCSRLGEALAVDDELQKNMTTMQNVLKSKVWLLRPQAKILANISNAINQPTKHTYCPSMQLLIDALRMKIKNCEKNYIGETDQTNQLLISLQNDFDFIKKLDAINQKIATYLKEKTNSTRVFALQKLQEAAEAISQTYSDDEKKSQEMMIPLSQKISEFEELDRYIKDNMPKFTQMNADSQHRKNALTHLQELVNKAYKQEISFKELQKEIELFYNLDVISNILLAITYDGQDEEYSGYLNILSTYIKNIYLSYAQAENITQGNEVKQKLIDNASDFFTSLKQRDKNKYGHFVGMFNRTNADSKLLTDANKARDVLKSLSLFTPRPTTGNIFSKELQKKDGAQNYPKKGIDF